MNLFLYSKQKSVTTTNQMFPNHKQPHAGSWCLSQDSNWIPPKQKSDSLVVVFLS